MTTNIALNEMLAATVAKIKTLAEKGAPLTLQLASVIRAEARTSRAIELGSDAPLSVGDCLTMEAFIAAPSAPTMPTSFTYERWRHGGWYVGGVRYPDGACGCVSRNYPDKKWRIACDPRPFDQRPTFKSRDDAARAEWKLANGIEAPRPDHVAPAKPVVTAESKARTARVEAGLALIRAGDRASVRRASTGGEGVQSGGVGVQSDVRAEFGDYGEPLPAIPLMYDASWENEPCPVLRDITGNIELWCDYADPAKREFPEAPRYTLHVDGDVIASGETLDHAILGALREALIRIMVRTWNYDPKAASYSLDTKGFTMEFRA